MMAAPTAPTTPDLLDVLAGMPPVTFGTRPPDLDTTALEAVLDAIDDRLETAPADVALELCRGRRMLELELARLLDA